jgi:hypothetical protein
MNSRRRIRDLPGCTGAEPIARPVARERLAARLVIEPIGRLLRCVSLHLTISDMRADNMMQRTS